MSHISKQKPEAINHIQIFDFAVTVYAEEM